MMSESDVEMTIEIARTSTRVAELASKIPDMAKEKDAIVAEVNKGSRRTTKTPSEYRPKHPRHSEDSTP